MLFTLVSYKKEYSPVSKNLLAPIFFYGLMVVSLSWSVNLEESADALVKELPLLLIPVSFYISGPLSKTQAERLLELFSTAIFIYGIWYFFRACYKYYLHHDANIFFYHQFSEDNAIYTSAVFAIGLYYYISKADKKKKHYVFLFFTMLCIILLSSKTIIITSLIIIAAYYLLNNKTSSKTRLAAAVVSAGIFIGVGYFSKIKDRLVAEYKSNTTTEKVYVNTENAKGFVYDVNMHDAWNKEKFNFNDRFTGTSFRIYQIRIFKEMMQEDNVFFTGYGLHASQEKIVRKGREHNVFTGNRENIGYQTMNFHNQYIQCFAELGVVGLLILLIMLALNLKKAIKNKYFIHIAFAVLMISLFLTESFLWRQRGVVLFTTLYCIFNGIAKRKKTMYEKNIDNRSRRFFGFTSLR